MSARCRTRSILAGSIVALIFVAADAGGAAAFTWSAPQPVPRPATGYPSLSLEANTDERGHQLVTFGSFGLWLLERAADAPWMASPVRVSSPGYGVRAYDAAVAGDGAAAVAWIERRRGHNRVRALVRDPGGAYRAPVDLASTRRRRSFRSVQVGVDAAGGALVAWDADVDHRHNVDHIEAAYRPAGGRFRPSRRVSRRGGALPAVGMSRDGRGVIAWVRGDGIETLAVQDGDFAKPHHISGPRSANGVDVRLAVHADGGAVIAWLSNLRSAKDPDRLRLIVRAARRKPGGDFAQPTRLRTIVGPDSKLQLNGFDVAAGPGGRAIVVLQESYRGDAQDGLDGTYSRLRGASAGRGRRFDDLVAISPPGQHGYVGRPALAFTPQGALVAAWGWYLDPRHSGVQIVSNESGAIAPPTTIAVPMAAQSYGVSHVRPRLTIDPNGTPTALWMKSAPRPGPTPSDPAIAGPDEPQLSIGLPSP